LSFTFFRQHRIWPFHVVVLQMTAKKCTRNYNARAQPLFCSLNLLFSDISVALAVVVFLGPVHTLADSLRIYFFSLWRADLFFSGFAVEFAGYVWTVTVSGKKKLRIRKYPDTCGRVRNDWETTVKIFARRQRVRGSLRWLETVSSTFQDLEFDGSL